MKIKKTKPTPKSITHKNPIKISPSSKNNQSPVNTKYNPAKYHSDIMLKVLMKKNKVIKVKVCNKNKSLSIASKHFDGYRVFTKVYVNKVVSRYS